MELGTMEKATLEVKGVQWWRIKWEVVFREDFSEEGTFELRTERWKIIYSKILGKSFGVHGPCLDGR